MFSRHVTRNISAYCQGQVSAEEAREFTAHIMACTKCRTRFEEIKLGIKFAEQLPQLSAPDHLWLDLEPRLGMIPSPQSTPARLFTRWQTQVAAIAAVLLLAAIVGVWCVRRDQKPVDVKAQSWSVQRIKGTPRINSNGVVGSGELAVGQWLETDGNSQAQIAVSSIGQVEIDPNTRVRLVETQPTEHRLELARGKMSARIWAPPRLFFVDT
ncbi:MAG TPA: zf-HC2 domain-containing protein, partial [Pyrinomonadaceae bacterium]